MNMFPRWEKSKHSSTLSRQRHGNHHPREITSNSKHHWWGSLGLPRVPLLMKWNKHLVLRVPCHWLFLEEWNNSSLKTPCRAHRPTEIIVKDVYLPLTPRFQLFSTLSRLKVTDDGALRGTKGYDKHRIVFDWLIAQVGVVMTKYGNRYWPIRLLQKIYNAHDFVKRMVPWEKCWWNVHATRKPVNRPFSQIRAPLAACREPTGKLWQLCKVL